MKREIDALLPEVESTPNGRRRHFRLKPAKMIAVLGKKDGPMDLSQPDLVIDFSLGGIAVVTEKTFHVGDEVLMSAFYEKLSVNRLPVVVLSKITHGPASRLGIKIDTEPSAYRLQKNIVEDMEMKCITRAEF
jgi:Tfp pilus assembly protein PilZ